MSAALLLSSNSRGKPRERKELSDRGSILVAMVSTGSKANKGSKIEVEDIY